MKHTIKMRTTLWTMLGVVCFVSTPAMADNCQPYWTAAYKCAQGCGPCASGSSGSGNSAPSYDYEAARRAQEAEAAAAAERQRQQAEADRIERERQAEIKRQKDAAFIRDRDDAANSLKGSTGSAMGQLKGLAGADNSGLKGSGFDTGSELKGLRGSDHTNQKASSKPVPHTDTSVVDARNVPSGLPKSVEKAIPHTPAGDRVRKGFQAIAERDWQVALAWFQDALNHEPGSPGLQRLVDLAQYTLQQQSGAAAKPIEAATATTKGKADKARKSGAGDELNQSLNDYYKNNPPKFLKRLKPGVVIQPDTEWLNEKEPAWKNFFRSFTPTFKVNEDGAVDYVGFRG